MIDMTGYWRTKAALMTAKRKDIDAGDIKELAKAVVFLCDELKKHRQALAGAANMINELTDRLDDLEG